MIVCVALACNTGCHHLAGDNKGDFVLVCLCVFVAGDSGWEHHCQPLMIRGAPDFVFVCLFVACNTVAQVGDTG